MGRASIITNGKSGTSYSVSTIPKHTKNYYVEAMGQKVDVTMQTRIKTKDNFTSKKQVVYVSWCGDDLSIDAFHEKMEYLTTVANDENLGKFIAERLNEESPWSAFEDKLFFRRKTTAIFVCDLHIAAE